jgi:CBS domain-containing protein
VADHAGKLLGVVAAGDLERTIARNANEQHSTAAMLMREAPTLRANDSLEQAILALGTSDDEALPVLATDDGRLIGWLSHRRVLNAYSQRLPHRPTPSQVGFRPKG